MGFILLVRTMNPFLDGNLLSHKMKRNAMEITELKKPLIKYLSFFENAIIVDYQNSILKLITEINRKNDRLIELDWERIIDGIRLLTPKEAIESLESFETICEGIFEDEKQVLILVKVKYLKGFIKAYLTEKQNPKTC